MIKYIIKGTFKMDVPMDKLITLNEGAVAAMINEAGCLKCQVLQGTTDPNVLIFEEEWEDENIYQMHLESEMIQKRLACFEGFMVNVLNTDACSVVM